MRQVQRAHVLELSQDTRYYLASFTDAAHRCPRRIRDYSGVKNKLHDMCDVTQGEAVC